MTGGPSAAGGRETELGSSLAFEEPRDLGWGSSLVCFLTCEPRYLEPRFLRRVPQEGAECPGLSLRLSLGRQQVRSLLQGCRWEAVMPSPCAGWSWDRYK